MSVLRYGDVNLGLVKTVKLDQRPKYEDSGTDINWFSSVLHAETIFTVLDNGAGLPNALAGEKTPAQVMARIQHMLLQPRQPLFYAPGGGTLIGIPGGLDSNNGPKPLRCDIVGLTDRTFRVEWDVEVAQPCPGASQLFASNRWEQEHSVSEKGYSTITTTGTLKTLSNMRTRPDQLRWVTLPPLMNDFHRHYRFRLSKDGLELHYQIDDEQVYLLPPEGCVDAEMKSGLTTSNGGAWEAYARVSLEGFKGQAKKALAEMAVLMAVRKIQSYKPILDPIHGHPIITGAAFEEMGFENKVDVMLRARVAQSPRVFVPGVAFQGGQAAAQGFFFGGGAGVVEAFKAIRDFFSDQDKTKATDRQRAIDLDRQLKEAQIKLEQDALVKSPPFQRLGEPLALTTQDAPGLDPGLRGDLPFFELLAAELRDPCLNEDINKLRTRTKKLPGPDPVSKEDHKLKGKAGKSTLTSFTLTDAGPFDQAIGLAGQDPFPGVYEYWHCDIDQESVSNADVLDATVAGALGRRVQWCNPNSTVTVRWGSVKLGYPPEVPVVADDNLVWVRTKVRLNAVFESADGITPAFAVAGVSEYKALDPSKVAMRGAIPPWMNVPMRTVPAPIPKALDLSTDSTGSTSSLVSRGQA